MINFDNNGNNNIIRQKQSSMKEFNLVQEVCLFIFKFLIYSFPALLWMTFGTQKSEVSMHYL